MAALTVFDAANNTLAYTSRPVRPFLTHSTLGDSPFFRLIRPLWNTSPLFTEPYVKCGA